MKPRYKVLVTGGGTREYIDDVRVLTNISSGKLSAVICDEFAKQVDCEVCYIHAKGSVLPESQKVQLVEISSVNDLMVVMENRVSMADIVIHAMAVSDFTFDRSNSVKLKSNDPEAFIEFMRQNIRRNPKVIKHFRGWNKDAYLVGFKFEVGKPIEELASIAFDSMAHSFLDLCIANDKKLMQEAGKHHAIVCARDWVYRQVWGKPEIAKAIMDEWRASLKK